MCALAGSRVTCCLTAVWMRDWTSWAQDWWVCCPARQNKALWGEGSCWAAPLPLGCLPAWSLGTPLQTHPK